MRLFFLGILFLSTYTFAGTVFVTWSESSSVVHSSVSALLLRATSEIKDIPPDVDLTVTGSVPDGSIVLSFGDTETSKAIIGSDELKNLGSEGFIVRSSVKSSSFLAARGNPLDPDDLNIGGNNGYRYSVYALLEALGFGFPHPLQIFVPDFLKIDGDVDIIEKPRWRIRGTHYHSEHPLEWTAVLNGFGDGLKVDEESWRVRLSQLDNFFQWLVCYKQNRLEWILLWAKDWKEFATSPERLARLKWIASRAREWGIAAGADVSIAERQQHAWYMVEAAKGTLDEQIEQIRARLEWLFVEAEFDFLSTESGTTEFTHPADTTMLAWINATAMLTPENKKTYIKCHCSSGQTCPHYVDPRTGDPLNFNFLPMLSSPSMGVMPHTVQIYDYHDPSFTYGNQNFSFMLDFLKYEVGKREVLYHGETAYWVTYDVDVPLFLPIYGDARHRDLKDIAEWEGDGKRMDGSMNFHSGLEWGYWLNDVVNFDASWNPLDDSIMHRRCKQWFGDVGSDVADVIVDYIDAQHRLLVYGNWSGTPPADIRKRSGQGLIEGWDMPTELAIIFDAAATIQPDRLGPLEVRNPVSNPRYSEIEPLLAKMEHEFDSYAQRMASIHCTGPQCVLLDEFIDSMQITGLRASLVHALWDYATGQTARLDDAKNVLSAASTIVKRREAAYRTDLIGEWQSKNPTVYTYGYLWPVHSLYFWWRDYGQATLACGESVVPCYLNLYNVAEIGGIDGIVNITEYIRHLADEFKWPERYVLDCLSAPEREYVFPDDIYQ